MSSTYGGPYSPGICIDDNVDGQICHTSTVGQAGTTNPWLQIDLGQARSVGRVGIHNRDKGTRLGQYELWLSDTDGAPEYRCAAASSPSPPPPRAVEISNDCVGRGRYVFVMLPGTERILNLAEVYVYSCPSDPSPPPPPHAPPSTPPPWPVWPPRPSVAAPPPPPPPPGAAACTDIDGGLTSWCTTDSSAPDFAGNYGSDCCQLAGGCSGCCNDGFLNLSCCPCAKYQCEFGIEIFSAGGYSYERCAAGP